MRASDKSSDWTSRREQSSFPSAVENECIDIVEQPATDQTKEETAHCRNLCPRPSRKKENGVHLDRVALYQGTARDERPQGGNVGRMWIVITVTTEPQGRKARPITDVTSTAL
jgi:hypothetical protein